MSVMSQCKYSALIMNKVWTQYDQIWPNNLVRIITYKTIINITSIRVRSHKLSL